LGNSTLSDLSGLKRRLAAVFAALAALLIAGGIVYHRHYQTSLRAEADKMLLSIEQIKLEQLQLWRESMSNSALSLLDGHRIAGYLRDLTANSADKKAADGLRARLRAFIERNGFQFAAMAGLDGKLLAYTGGKPEKMCPEVTSLIAKAKATGLPQLGDFYLHPGETTPHIDVVAPALRAAPGRDLFLLLRLAPANFLYPLLQTWSGKGETGEVLLVGRDGDELVFLNDLRHVKDAAMRLRRPLTAETLPAAMGLLGKTGIVEGLDYRGVPVIAAVGPVPGTDWAMVTKMDRDEVLKGTATLAVLLALLVLALLAAAGAGAFLLFLRQAAAYERIRINYNLFSEKANDGMLAVDLETLTVSEANRRACEMYGYPPEKMSGLKLGKVIPTGDLENFRRRMSENLRAGSRVYEVSHQRSDGTVFPAEISANVAEVDGRKTMFLIVRDVSERKSAQELLARLTEQVPGVVYQYRLYPDGRSCFPYASSGMELIYEVTPEEVREDATPVFGRLHPDELKATSEAIFASARDLSVFHWEFRVVLPKQGLRWRLCDARPERLPDGGTLWHGIITDITDRKLAEQELWTLSQQRELALSAARLGWWRYDPVSKVSSYDERYKEIFEVTGSSQPNADILKRLHQEDLPGVWAKVTAALDPARRENYSAEYRVNMPDGRVKWIEAHGLAAFDAPGPGGRALELVGTVADITARKQAEAEIRKLNQDLVAKNKEMENFLYITTHDLRSPLVNIQGFSQNLQRYLGEMREALAGAGLPKVRKERVEKIADEKVPEALGFVLESSAKMDALLSALLKVSRLGRQELNPETLDMGTMMRRIVDTMLFQVREAGAEVKIGLLPSCRADAASVSQLFSNLLDNAVKYRDDDRKLVVEIDGETRGGMAVYRVADNGPGIPAADLERLWDIFYKPARAGKKNGEGIGLPMCRRIAERNGGGIRVEANPGGGSVFVVELPAA